MSATIDTWIGRLGLVTGMAVVAAWLAMAGSPGTAPEPTATFRLAALMSGELEISPTAKPVVEVEKLRADGRPHRGAVTVRNLTPVELAFALRVRTTERELDRAAWIEVKDGADVLLRSTLGHARAWTPKSLYLARGERRTLDVRVWIPEDAPDGWQAGRGDTTIEFSSNPGAAR